MKITMDMSSNEIEHDSMEAEYGDDILYAGWNPEIGSVKQQLQHEMATEQRGMPVATTTKVTESFLGRIYSFLH